jgi:hypothetical protein
VNLFLFLPDAVFEDRSRSTRDSLYLRDSTSDYRPEFEIELVLRFNEIIEGRWSKAWAIYLAPSSPISFWLRSYLQKFSFLVIIKAMTFAVSGPICAPAIENFLFLQTSRMFSLNL